MENTFEQISILKTQVLEGKEISFQDAEFLMSLSQEKEIHSLRTAAHEITQRFQGKKPELCSLVNAKSYLCREDCAFCAQSAHHKTQTERYPLMAVEEVLTIAKQFEKEGIKDFCIVTSGAQLSEEEFEKVLEMCERLKKETTLQVDGSLGFLTRERAEKLKDKGMRRYNSNLQTSETYYPEIVSTHPYEERKKALNCLKETGIEICCGGILGLGENENDRLKLAFELKPYQPKCIPINLLNPRPGTPLEKQPRLNPKEILKTIAVFRFIHPKANIKLAGGREKNLSTEDQKKALCGGANGMILGGYLTTRGNPIQKDKDMLKTLGYQSD